MKVNYSAVRGGVERKDGEGGMKQLILPRLMNKILYLIFVLHQKTCFSDIFSCIGFFS